MALEMGGFWMRHAPHVLMILVQLSYTLQYFVTEAAFSRGLNPYVYVTYRNFLAVLLLPFAYYHEKKLRPKLTLMLFLEIFVLSILGVSLSRNMHFASLKYTSSTFVSTTLNTVASMTFVIAVILRMEIVSVKTVRGLAKIAGTIVSFAGVTILTLYKGGTIKSLWKSPVLIHGDRGSDVHESWVKGSILAIASCLFWAFWYIMQASSLKRYPAQLSLTTWMNLVGGIQSAVFTVFMQHKPEDWLIGFGLNFWCIVYSSLACNGFAVVAQLWCTEKKGPVFVTMFSPLCSVMAAFLAYFIFGENLYFGSIIGGVVVIAGMYMLLWGKDKDHQQQTSNSELDYEKQVRESDFETPKTTK